MARIEKSIVIDAPVEKVFGRIANPRTNVEDLPSVIEVKDFAGEGAGMTWRTVYKMVGLHFELEMRFLEYVPNERLRGEFKGGIEGTSTWAFEPCDGGTRVTVVYDYAIPVPVLGRLAEPLVRKQNEREADLFLANLKARVEA